MDQKIIESLNTEHFCQWYKKKLTNVLDLIKVNEWRDRPCSNLQEFCDMICRTQDLDSWDDMVISWANSSQNVGMWGYGKPHGLGESKYRFFELSEEMIRRHIIGVVPLLPNYVDQYMREFPPISQADLNLQPNKKGFTEKSESVKSTPVETETTKEKEIMQTIKESAVKTKDQVIKTAIGQAGVASIKSLILTALPMKIGFISRLLGRHKAAANNSLVVAGIAIIANQAAQKFITNEAAKNVLQATQDQAVTEVLNEYIGIENQIQKTLDLENVPVTVD